MKYHRRDCHRFHSFIEIEIMKYGYGGALAREDFVRWADDTYGRPLVTDKTGIKKLTALVRSYL